MNKNLKRKSRCDAMAFSLLQISGKKAKEKTLKQNPLNLFHFLCYNHKASAYPARRFAIDIYSAARKRFHIIDRERSGYDGIYQESLRRRLAACETEKRIAGILHDYEQNGIS